MSAELEERIRATLRDHTLDQAVTVVLRGYGPRIYRYLRAMLRDRDAADDAFAEFGERLWRALPGFRHQSTALVWCHGIAHHTACRIIADPYRRRRRDLSAAHVSQLVAEVRTATAEHVKTESKQRLARLRDELTPDERALLNLRVDQRLAWDEIAAILDGSEAALRKRYERLKDKLSRLARARGLLSGR